MVRGQCTRAHGGECEHDAFVPTARSLISLAAALFINFCLFVSTSRSPSLSRAPQHNHALEAAGGVINGSVIGAFVEAAHLQPLAHANEVERWHARAKSVETIALLLRMLLADVQRDKAAHQVPIENSICSQYLRPTRRTG